MMTSLLVFTGFVIFIAAIYAAGRYYLIDKQ